jgi:hypothetical protein
VDRKPFPEVEEGLRDAGRDPGPLDERAVEAEDGRRQRIANIGRGDTDGDIGARRAPGRLLACVGRDIGAGAHHELVRGAVVDVTRSRSASEITVAVVRRFRPHIATHLQADVGARHVIKACAIKATDLHILYWLGLDRKISCLPSRNHQTGRGAEEEAFRHFEPVAYASPRRVPPTQP